MLSATTLGSSCVALPPDPMTHRPIRFTPACLPGDRYRVVFVVAGLVVVVRGVPGFVVVGVVVVVVVGMVATCRPSELVAAPGPWGGAAETCTVYAAPGRTPKGPRTTAIDRPARSPTMAVCVAGVPGPTGVI